MSGTSMDGIDASIIQSNGDTEYNVILDQFFEYDDDVYSELIKIRFTISLDYRGINSIHRSATHKSQSCINFFHSYFFL